MRLGFRFGYIYIKIFNSNSKIYHAQNPHEDNSSNQRHMLFDKNKVNLFLKDLNSELNLL
jgi:hypothetical protein